MKNGGKYPKPVLLLGAIAVIIGVVIIWHIMFLVSQVSFSEEYAQAKLSENLPYHKEFNRLLMDFGVTVTDLTVNFQSGNKIHVVAVGEVETTHGNAEIIVETTGIPVYSQGAFYFLPESFNLMEFRLSETAQGNVDKYGRIVKSAAKKYFGQILDDAGVKVDARKISEKIKTKAEKTVQNALIKYFYSHPVKELEGVKGKVLRLAIKNIEVKNGELTIYFSLIQFTFGMLLIILVPVVIVVLVLSGPWWIGFFPLV